MEYDCTEDIADELQRLQDIVDKLPKTADGVPVAHGMKVWHPDDYGHGTVTIHVQGEGGYDRCGDCYSTQAAAQAAADAAKEGA